MDRLYSVTQAAYRVSRRRQTIWERIRKGTVAARRVGFVYVINRRELALRYPEAFNGGNGRRKRS